MSLSAALSSAVSGLNAQSVAISAISENIANSSTTAYKTKDVSFSAMVTGSVNSSTSVSGVSVRSSQAMLTPGLISSTSEATNLAIDGNGFFVVAANADDRPAEYVYTRNGSFSTDANGNLVNEEGYLLLGYATDADGNISSSNSNDLSGLTPISVKSINGTAKATHTISMSANLPADADVGASFSSSVEVIDSVGVSQTVKQTWTKTAANTWTLDLADPTTTDTGVASGSVSPNSFQITFDGNGVLSDISPSDTNITLSGLTSGAGDSTVNLDLGTAGATSGLTQYASSSSSADIEINSVVQDGARYGQLSNISIDDSGLVTAHFDNGISRAIYQVPIATFSNASGLTHISGTVYDEAAAAGTLNLGLPGEGNAGSIQSSALEGSTTDTATEFNKMIIAQQAYSAAAQVISAVDEMFTTLTQALR